MRERTFEGRNGEENLKGRGILKGKKWCGQGTNPGPAKPSMGPTLTLCPPI